MNWSRIAFGISVLLSIALIVRLISVRLYATYGVLCGFLLFQILSESFAAVMTFTSIGDWIDYRVVWLVMRVLYWTLLLWMVYALLQDILEKLPGILRFSKRVLNVVIPLSFAISLVIGRMEYVASGVNTERSTIAYLVGVALIMERFVTTIALLSLVLMLLFLLWFPVTLPRNLAVLSTGFAIYFTTKTALLLLHSFSPQSDTQVMDNTVTLILCICLLYWIIFINATGETVPVTISRAIHSGQETKLISDLEHLNSVLARAGRR